MRCVLCDVSVRPPEVWCSPSRAPSASGVREIANAGIPRPRCRWWTATSEHESRRHPAERHRYNYTILHYECLVNDWDEIKKHLPIDFLVLDEITAIKGFTAKRSERAKALGKHCPVRMGLSGQPVENRPEELFSIMEFIDPEVLGPFDKFDRTFIVRDHWGRPKRYRNLPPDPEARWADAMYRKSREDIAEWLPEKIEIEMPVVLDRTTHALHDLVRRRSLRRHRQGHRPRRQRWQLRRGGPLRPRHMQTDGSQLMGQVMSRLLACGCCRATRSSFGLSAESSIARYQGGAAQYASELKAAGLLDNLPLDNGQARRPDRHGRPRSSLKTRGTRSWCSATSSRCWP